MNNYYTIDSTPELQNTAYNLWQPAGTTNRKIHVDTGINSNWSYRQYMQKNANDIMKYNSMQSIQDSGNNPYTISNTNSTETSPYLFNSIHDNRVPLYGFRDSDLKQNYITKQQMKAKMISPSIPTNF